MADENQNEQTEGQEQKTVSNGSLFLKQIKDKRSQYTEDHQEKKTIFKGFSSNSSSPKKPTEEPDKKKKKGMPILAILGALGLLFLLFVLLMMAVLAMGGANSSLLVAFNIDGSRFRDVLLFIVNGSFGLAGFIVLIVFVVALFRTSLAKKEEKEKRKASFKRSLFTLVYLFIVLGLWVGTYGMVTQIQFNVPLSQLKIQTTPEDVSSLHAPVDIVFNTDNILKALVERKLVPTSLNWDFDGDGNYEVTVEDKSIQHRFEQEGSFKVGLIVNLDGGGSESFSILINITGASFMANPIEGPAPLEVKFDASSLERRDEAAASFEWDFDGDGTYDTKETKSSITHVFTQIGTYNVQLRIIDIHNNFRVYSQIIEVYKDTAKKLEAKISLSPGNEGVAPFKINLDAADSTSRDGKIQKYEWDFGDGSSVLFGNRVSHTFKKEGEYTITLILYDTLGNIDRSSLDVVVKKSLSAPVAKIKTTPEIGEEVALKGLIPFNILFDGGESEDGDENIVTYAWDFNSDGEIDYYGQRVEHSFEEAGDYNVKLIVTDADDQVSESTILVKTEQQALQAILEADPVSGSLPLTVNFDASTSIYKDGEIITYEWDFGDGSGSGYGDAKRTHVYEREGRYVVNLKVFTDDDKTATTKTDIFVRAMQLQACFSYNPKTGSAPLTISFESNCSKGEVSKWKWDFGDGFISTGHSPKHTFSVPGEYDINLEVMDSKNNISSFKSVLVVD